jgi:hypothetical protein
MGLNNSRESYATFKAFSFFGCDLGAKKLRIFQVKKISYIAEEQPVGDSWTETPRQKQTTPV